MVRSARQATRGPRQAKDVGALAPYRVGASAGFYELFERANAQTRKTANTPRIVNRQSPIVNSRGAVLIAVIIIMLTVSLIGATLAAMFSSVTTRATVELHRAQALYLAEAGLAAASHQLRQAGITGTEVPKDQPPVSLGEGSYQFSIDFGSRTITSLGEAHGVRRMIQVKYQLF